MAMGVLMLAAGSSRRFGSDKRMARLSTGTTLLQKSLDNARDSGLPVTVCLGPGDTKLAGELRTQGFEVHLCPNALQGMGATLADGIAHIQQWDCVLVALADMGWLTPETFRTVAEQCDQTSICVPVFEGQRGHPVGFGRAFFAQLRELHGDQGAKGIVEAHEGDVRELHLSDPGIIRDADTPDQLAD